MPASGRQIATGSTFAPRKCRAGMSIPADSTRLSTFPPANADRARHREVGIFDPRVDRVAAVLVADTGRVGNDGGRMMHDRVLHMGGRAARGVTRPLGVMVGGGRPSTICFVSAPQKLVDGRPPPTMTGKGRAAARISRRSTPKAVTPEQVWGDKGGSGAARGLFDRNPALHRHPGLPLRHARTCSGHPRLAASRCGPEWARAPLSRMAGRCARQRKGAPNPPAPPLLDSGKYTPNRVPSQAENACSR